MQALKGFQWQSARRKSDFYSECGAWRCGGCADFKKRKAYYEGKAINFHEFSEDRIEPICQHFGACGGCKWQNMTYEKQLFYKNNEVFNHLKRIGKIELPEFEPILGSEKKFFYRNKMEFSFSNARWLTEKELASDEEFDNKMLWVFTFQRCGTRF